MDIKVENICRACLAENDSMLSLFDVYEHELTLAMILKSCINIEICENDGLPSHLCDNCILVLTQFYNFTVVFEESNKHLQKYFIANQQISQTKTEIAEVVEETIIDQSEMKNDFLNGVISESIIYNPDYSCFFSDSSNNMNLIVQQPEVIEQCNVKYELIEPANNVNLKKESLVNKSPLKAGQSYEEIVKYECTICGETHLYVAGFQQHMRLKHQMQDIDCEKYASRMQVKNYSPQNKNNSTIKKEQLEQPVFTCETCNKQFLSEAQLQYHAKLHNSIKNYICEVCGSSFIRKTYLADHMEGHSTEKNHKCKFCGKAFKRRTVLRAHKRVHTHPKHYVCEECGRAFTNSSTLKTHRLLIHIKERNFKCMICNLTFPLKSTLNKHVLRHQKRENGEKGFNCTLCHMEYRDKSSLKRHFENKHQGKVELIKCGDCPKKYTSKANLMKHKRQHHNALTLAMIPKLVL